MAVKWDTELESLGSLLKSKPFQQQTFDVIWITGQTGAGKTTLGLELKRELGGILLDGDGLRETLSEDLDLSKGGRWEHNLRTARLSRYLARQLPVFVAVIAPYQDLRLEITKICDPIWVHLEKPSLWGLDPLLYPYEAPPSPHLRLNTDELSVDEEIQQVTRFLYRRAYA